MVRRIVFLLVGIGLLLALAGIVLVTLNLRGEDKLPAAPTPFESSQALVERGRYLALAGNCAGCHTVRGGAPYAGGLGIGTPFGTIFASNLTPDEKNGIGGWSVDHFWRAIHNGRSKDGHLLYPAFPYPSFTKLKREDSDALYAYLRTVPRSDRPNTEHALRFPYNTQLALAVWRALSFKPGAFEADPARPAEWNRGAYLVEGAGHCIACHGARNSLGATQDQRGLSGGLIPGENWYAPALTSPREAGVADWELQHIVSLLKTGTSPRGSVMGPMADVVWSSTQHLSEHDLGAIAQYLRQLPQEAPPPAPPGPLARDPAVMARGGGIYAQRCAYCHGDGGEGAPGAYPPLAGNRSVNMEGAANLVQILRHGGFLPATAGNPRPYGMPPFGHVLDDEDIAAVLTYVRGSWGNDAPSVSLAEAMRR
ncbi:MAG TPA: cytochrome c [Variovorax sp.]|nr:cytochrome c [Variovorax sp.]